ncbi:conserved membrane hypothetical protein [Vibrio crassostreae]|nr:conserved membrane hypothetical protein [Vibrio crassostreae]CAK3646070.1 conserved membrane hypothetical protein [Vibrio crassostreae]
MEELKYLARTYYSNTVSMRYFGMEGLGYLSISIILFALAGYLQLVLDYVNISILPMLIAFFLGGIARRHYDKNLIRHLSSYTLLDSDNIDFHKAVYLQSLVSHIGESLLEAMKNLKEVRETDASKHGLSTQSEWSRFFQFIYSPDSKNRILSLVIYLISLIALITVSKSESDTVLYELLQNVTWDNVQSFAFFSIILIVTMYALVVLPISFVYKYFAVPILLKTSSVDTLSRFFISELNRYAYLECRANRSC